jgi:phosphonate transport system ATP-binding protein
MLKLENTSVSYNDLPVLRDINLTIEEGEKIVLVGPSGAGKSTLLRKLYDVVKGRSAFIHQDYALVAQLTTFHNVYMGRLDQHNVFYNGLNLAYPRGREIEAITPLLQALNLEDKLHERVAELSGGEQQRVAVARALFRDADIVFGDEPVSAIDPHQSDAVLALLKQHSRTLILAMHDIDLALRHFDRIIGLRSGRVFFDASSSEVGTDRLAELFSP